MLFTQSCSFCISTCSTILYLQQSIPLQLRAAACIPPFPHMAVRWLHNAELWRPNGPDKLHAWLLS